MYMNVTKFNENILEDAYQEALNDFIEGKNLKSVISKYRKVIKLGFNHAQAYYDLGYMFYLLKKPKKALKYFKNYLSLNPYCLDKKEIEKIIKELRISENRLKN